MILPDFNDFPRKGRILGIDWGARRIGLAVSDENHGFVFERPVLVQSDMKTSAKQIYDLIRSEKIVGVVVGLPLRSDGSDSDTTRNVRDFAKELTAYTDIPVAFIDESLTSIEAQEKLGRIRVSDIKRNLDSAAARVILENAISLMNRI